jgi:hypothetical protein
VTDDDAEEPIFDDEPRRRLEDDPLARLALPIGRSPWAIIAGYLGLLSVLLIPAPAALVTGVLALREIRRNPRLGGKGRAIFAILMGVPGTILFLLLLAIYIYALVTGQAFIRA